MVVGRDFKLAGYDGGLLNIFIYPVLEINDKKSENFKKSFIYKEL